MKKLFPTTPGARKRWETAKARAAEISEYAWRNAVRNGYDLIAMGFSEEAIARAAAKYATA